MDELEFQRILSLFPIVRPRDFAYDDTASSRRQMAQPAQNEQLQDKQDALNGKDMESTDHRNDQRDAFWSKLQMTAEKKVGAAEAERFCKDFRKIYKILVYEGLSLDAARKFLSSSNNYGA